MRGLARFLIEEFEESIRVTPAPVVVASDHLTAETPYQMVLLVNNAMLNLKVMLRNSELRSKFATKLMHIFKNPDYDIYIHSKHQLRYRYVSTDQGWKRVFFMVAGNLIVILRFVNKDRVEDTREVLKEFHLIFPNLGADLVKVLGESKSTVYEITQADLLGWDSGRGLSFEELASTRTRPLAEVLQRARLSGDARGAHKNPSESKQQMLLGGNLLLLALAMYHLGIGLAGLAAGMAMGGFSPEDEGLLKENLELEGLKRWRLGLSKIFILIIATIAPAALIIAALALTASIAWAHLSILA